MAPSIEAIINPISDDPALVQRISHRNRELMPPLAIADYDPSWPAAFQHNEGLIRAALTALPGITIAHVGSTSIPSMPAKPVIDIDLVVPNPSNEFTYAPQLEAAGFQFLLREPQWNEHRLFCAYGPPSVNLHVFGPDAAEPVRHQIFRDWVLGNEADRELYVRAKRAAVEGTVTAGETEVQKYNERKEAVIREILDRAFKSLGYI